MVEQSDFPLGLFRSLAASDPLAKVRSSDQLFPPLVARKGSKLADGTIALISGGLSGGFALAGVGLSNWTSARRERRIFGRETALELAGMERLVWGDSWVELKATLQRQEDRLAVAGISEELIRDFRTISIACWHDQRDSAEHFRSEERGMSTRLVEARQAVHDAARAELLEKGRRKSRRALRAEASMLVDAALSKRQKRDDPPT